MKKIEKKQWIHILLAFVILNGVAFGVYRFLDAYQLEPSGNDIWGHLYKSNYLYENIKDGNWYPLYSPDWYNGLQPYRYWAPLPYYILAFLQGLAKGDVIGSYYFFAYFTVIVGGGAFILWGISSKRMVLCTTLGVLWFFLPDNYRVYFCEGNIPRMVTTIWIPYLIYFVWRYIKSQSKVAMLGIMLVMSLLTFSHVMIAAMVGVGTFFYLVFYCGSTHKYKVGVQIILGMLLSFLLCGIWLVPALIGGLLGMDTTATGTVMESLTYDLQVMLNPMNRINGVTDTYYYGISIAILSIIGILLSKRREKAGYWTTIVILVLTTPILVPIITRLPLSQVLWTMRFSTIGYGFFFLSFVEWTNIKRWFCVFLMGLVILDSVPSLLIERYYTPMKGNIEEELDTMKEITTNRATNMDISSFGSYPSYKLCTDDGILYGYGWAWQGATTADNIVRLNTALLEGYYTYLFDRCVELGNDTVLIRKRYVNDAGKSFEELNAAANLVGYQLVLKSDEAYLYHMETPTNFGVKTEYEGIGIGKYASQLEYLYPNFTHGESIYLDEYTVEELSQYKTVFLSGFEYHKLENAEKLVQELSKKEVRVVIDMQNIPIDRVSNRKHFLDVYSQDISFNNSYPNLYMDNHSIVPVGFSSTYDTWNTVFIDGATTEIVTAEVGGKNITVAGRGLDENVIFLGFNLLSHSLETKDPNILSILSTCFKSEVEQLPTRTLIPINVTYTNKGMIIETKEANINTTIAYQDNFKSDHRIEKKNNLLYVSDTKTEIEFSYPYLKEGSLVSMTGGAFTILFFVVLDKWNRNVDIENASKNIENE